MFKLPSRIMEELNDYKAELAQFLAGKINYSRFTGVRVPWGIYSHRGKKLFMNRIRIPAGVVDAAQLKAIAHVAKEYGNGLAHITTRQDIQVHGIKIEDTFSLMEYLKAIGLSSRGGGGNTVRNITSCVFSGLCQDEVFDTRADAIALSEYLLAQDNSYNLPRKLKISFSSCSKDCSGCLINDIGLLARIKNGKKGFQVFVGGGMGLEPRLGKLLEEFILREDLGFCAQAVENVFYQNGERKNKHHNRLRFLIEDLGFEKFKGLYAQELKSLKENEYIALRKIDFVYPETPDTDIPRCAEKEYQDFLKYNVFTQKQQGRVSVELRIPRGDLTGQELSRLADLEVKFGEIEFRTSQRQNLFICNLKKSDLYALFSALKLILKDFLYPSTLLDVVCCKGALTCNLGLCNSPALTEELEKMIKENFIYQKAFTKIDIKINGCPNSCGQHPLGAIGLHGMVRRVFGRAVPFYKLLLGGRTAAENSRLAKDTGVAIPTRALLGFLKDFISAINEGLSEDTDIYQYLDEKGEDLTKEVASKYSYVPTYDENKNFYIDWGRNEDFSLEGLGPGECGAGVIDMIEADLSDGKIALEKAKQNNYAASSIKQSLFYSSRALLVARGSDPKDEKSSLRDFVEKFVKAEIAPLKYVDLEESYEKISDDLTLKEKEEKFLYAQEFLNAVNDIYKNMDPTFNFPKPTVKASLAGEKKEYLVLDLKGTPCPINYVKAKLYLENLQLGDIVEIFLDEGDPVNNVPKSLKSDGQEILRIEKVEGFYKVTVKKNK